MRIHSVSCNEGTVINDLTIVILQNCMVLLKVEPDLYSETYLKCSHSGTQDVTDMKEEEDPLLISFPVTKAEQEVSFVWLWL